MDEFGLGARQIFSEMVNIWAIIFFAIVIGLACIIVSASIAGIISLILSERRRSREVLDKNHAKE